MTIVTEQLPAERDVVVIQRNPTSGTGRRQKELLRFIRTLRSAGYLVRSFHNRDALDRWVSDHPDPERIRCVVAAGGDGTLANVAQRHPDFALCVFPMGTENLFARHLNIPRDGREAAQVVVNGVTANFDTGLVNGQRFLIMISCGVDAEVVRRLSLVRRGNIRHTSYLRPILNSFLRYNYPRLTVQDADGRVLAEGSHVIVANLPEYGFGLPFAKDATPHDGLLDVAVFRPSGKWRTMWHAVKLKLGLNVESNVTRFRQANVSITSAGESVPIQFDGDPCGVCPAGVSVDAATMRCLIPADFELTEGELA